ncbi:hypothetical protein F2Q69_00009301 [Brassica cretica]|uniref:Uncharacterized protein n=1 Tax=Brassica cretica TaxID=69181 RepID=A0A8S9PEM9_BRACR|nr:hypothetical protein F2Q69_00009301 [Brassica cretica]
MLVGLLMLFELERAEDKLPHVKGIGVSANHADERVKKLEENVSMMANNFNKLVQRFDKVEKERRMDVPQAQMQYDDKSRVDKAKRRPVVEQTESKNKVELFLHLPQYERGNQLPNLSSNL